MKFTEIFRLAFASLRASPMRSILTMLGITVGVFSVIGVMTFVDAIKVTVEQGFSRYGANTVQINRFSPNRLLGSDGWGWREPIRYRDALRARERLEGEFTVSVHDDTMGKRVTYLERKTNPSVAVIGTDDNYLGNQGYAIAEGRNLEREDVEQRRRVCVIGATLAEVLFPSENPIGKEVAVDGKLLTVIGVLQMRGESLGRSLDEVCLMPIPIWLTSYQRRDGSVVISARVDDARRIDELRDRLIGVMREVRGLGPEDVNDFAVTSNDSELEKLGEISAKIAAGAFVISFIALLAAGVGVMNIMLVSVVERTKEIGVRKSLGARKRSILRQFLLEAVVLTLGGGLLGVLLGVIAGNLVAYKMDVAVQFPWLWAGIGMMVCGVIGLVFGIYPAWRAASLDPIEALRHD